MQMITGCARSLSLRLVAAAIAIHSWAFDAAGTTVKCGRPQP